MIHKTTPFDERRTIVITDTPPNRRTQSTDDYHGFCYYVETVIYTDGTIEESPLSSTQGTIEECERIAMLCLNFQPAPPLTERPAAPPPKPEHWHQHVCMDAHGCIDCVNPACFKPGQRLLTDQIVCPRCGEITGAIYYFHEPKVNELIPATAPDIARAVA